MELKDLEIEPRTELGRLAVGRLRRTGFVPGVIYSTGLPATSIVVKELQFSRVVTGSVSTQLFRLKSANSELDGQMALVKSIQREPKKDLVLHVDFLAVSEGHRITVTVPLELFGEVAAVKLGEMILNQTLYELELECLPTEIPAQIRFDVSSLREGVSFHVKDLTLPEGVTLKSDPSLTVVTLAQKSEEEVAAKTAEAAPVAADAAAAAAAPGAAPAPEAEKDKGKGGKEKSKD